MGHKNYISLVDEIISNAEREVDCFSDTKEEAESLCDYLERRIKDLCDNVKGGFNDTEL